jgi:activator of HSP90 ATPase
MFMVIDFEVSETIPATQAAIYDAWLDSEDHSRMTGGQANVSNESDASFDAWDGYIKGVNIELESPKRILQRWRTAEFDENDEDSLLEILLEPEGEATRVTIRHSNLPEHGMQYRQGWIDAYFTPMKEYFGQDPEESAS